MEDIIVEQVLTLKKHFSFSLEEATKEVLRQEFGRQAMQGACAIFEITPKEYVERIVKLAEARIKNKGA